MTNDVAIRRIQNHMKVHKMGEYPHVLIKEALDMAIDALREHDEQRWIPVAERLPDNNCPVLVRCAQYHNQRRDHYTHRLLRHEKILVS